MRPFMSAFVPKLNAWMTVCTLGDALLTELAQHASYARAYKSGATEKPAKYNLLNEHFSVKDTPWDNASYQSPPAEREAWGFSADGIMRHFSVPFGIWQVLPDGTIQVFTYLDDNPYPVELEVKFTSQDEITVYRDGHPYKYGARSRG